MTARQVIVPGAMPSRDANGRALPAKLRFYMPGTTIPKTVYTSSALSVAHPFPILSDDAGRFPAIWADDAQTFDVGWSDQVYDKTIRAFATVIPTADAVLASVGLSEAAADAAEAAQAGSEAILAELTPLATAVTDASASAAAAAGSASSASTSASSAAASSGAATASAISAGGSAGTAQAQATSATLSAGEAAGLVATALVSAQDVGYQTAWAATSIPSSIKSLKTTGYAAYGDGGSALYKRVTSQPAHSGSFRSQDRYLPDGTVSSGNGGWWAIAETTIRPAMFGSGLTAWQAAATVVNAGVAGIISVPPGVQTISRAGLGSKLTGLITFTANTLIAFEEGASLQFDYIGLPLFCFSALTAGGIVGRPKFVFTGSTPTATDATRTQYATASGFNSASFIGGGDYELFTIVLSNSSGLTFDNFDVSSATPNDETHCIPCVFNLKPATASTRATGNRVLKPRFRDFHFGMLFVQQDGLHVKDVDADRRAGLTTSSIGPGHVIYGSGLGTGTPNINCVIEGVREGANPINWPASIAQNLAPFAIKDCQFCEFNDVRSYHPAGLVQTFQKVFDCDFKGWSWRTTDTTALTVTPMNFVLDNQRNRFVGFTIYAPSKVFSFGADSSGVFSDNLISDVFVDASFDLGAGSVTGVFDFYGSNNDIRNAKLKPHAAPIGATHQAAAIQRLAGGTGNTVEAQVIGSFATPKMRRFNDTGTGSVAKISLRTATSDTDYLNNDQLPLAISKGTFVQTGTDAARGYTLDGGLTGAATVTFQLPGRGSFILSVDVEDNARTGGMGGAYLVTFSNQSANIANAQLIGATYTRGSTVSSLAVSVSATGLVTVGYTKSSAFFATTSLGWMRLGSIVA